MTFLIWRQIRKKFEHDVSSLLEKDLGLEYNLTEVLLEKSSFKKKLNLRRYRGPRSSDCCFLFNYFRIFTFYILTCGHFNHSHKK